VASDDRAAYVTAAATVITWSSAFAAIRAALDGYGAVHLSFLRLAVSSVGFVLVAPLLHVRLPGREDLARVLALGVLGMAAYHTLLNRGEEQVTAATASLIIATVPIFTLLLAVPLLGERLSGRRVAGIAVAATGIAVVAFGGDGDVRLEPAALLVLGAAMCAAGYTVLQKPLLTRVRAVDLTAWATWTGTLLLVPLALPGLAGAVRDAPTEATVAVVWLGLVPSTLGYAFYAATLARLEASVAAAFLYLVPPVATVIAWVWLGEVPGPVTVVGGALCLTGVVIATRLTLRRGAPSGRANDDVTGHLAEPVEQERVLPPGGAGAVEHDP
jgi:drug/metabolite transporter (DMT)-like permease